jgi:parvulin-like peptidyl-prolyl isomerase
MIGTIRKHSKWLWWSIIPLTILSFVVYMGSGPAKSGSGGGGGNLGSVAGKKVTRLAYSNARRDVFLFYLFHYGVWPDSKEAHVPEADLDREIYVRLLLLQKADELGIQVGDAAAVAAANTMLLSLGRNGQTVPMEAFVQQVLAPKSLTGEDFERFVRHDLAIQQLVQSLGLTGELVTPQEASAVYQRENREISAQVVFFSATNYLSAVKSTPADLGQFYTNFLAAYRLPERVQVSYVEFNPSNYLAAAEQKLSKTNFQDQIDAVYLRNGAKAFPTAKTPAEAKAIIREQSIREQAEIEARLQASELAGTVNKMEPAKPENLAIVAKQKGLTVRTLAPFGRQFGPEEFTDGAFSKAAFELTLEYPVSGMIKGQNAFYVLALDKNLPEEIPSFDSIHDRVVHDYEHLQAIRLAQQDGTNFYFTATVQMAAGKSFTQAAIAGGKSPQSLPAFSLSTDILSLPELTGHIEPTERGLNQFKQAAFGTPVGKLSAFESTSDGGYVIYVQSQLPLDQSKMDKEFPQFLSSYRRARLNEAFNAWLFKEANKSLQDTPVGRQQAAAASGAAN